MRTAFIIIVVIGIPYVMQPLYPLLFMLLKSFVPIASCLLRMLNITNLQQGLIQLGGVDRVASTNIT